MSHLLQHQIREFLLQRIEQGEPGTKLPAERVVAERFGTSLQVVKPVLQELALRGFVDRQVGRGTFVKKRRELEHFADADLCPGGRILFMYPNDPSLISWTKVSAVETKAHAAHLHLTNVKIQSLTDYEVELGRQEKIKDYTGIILMHSGRILEETFLRKLDQVGCPVVVLDPVENIEAYDQIHSVCEDYYGLGRHLMHILLEMTCHRVGYFRNAPVHRGRRNYAAGIRSAWEEAGRPARDLVISRERPSTGRKASGSDEAVRLWRDERVDGMITDSFHGTVRALRAQMKLGMAVMEKPVVSGPGHPEETYYVGPPVHIGRYSIPRIAEEAVKVVTRPAGQPKEVRIPVDSVRFAPGEPEE